jgi:phenylacetate-coenzyme A ligase PaaK-like adenylate-forming protein
LTVVCFFNGYFVSAALCSTDDQNRFSKKYSILVETIIKLSKFDTTKPMFILKSKEHGYDIHLFQQYWIKKYSQQCLFIDPKQLKIENEKLIDKNTNYFIEQFILELHQDEILALSDDILELFIKNNQLNYINDFRTIFILHDKRLFSLLSSQQFLYALLNNQQNTFTHLIPTTYIINKIPSYLKDSIINNKQHWCIKPNSAGKGENVTIGIIISQFLFLLKLRNNFLSIGVDVSSDEWSCQLLDSSHEQWIVQQYIECVQYESMNLSGMLFCFHDQCFNMGIVRVSPNKIVNISCGGYYIRPYVHREHIHSMKTGSILTKENLHKQLIELKSNDNQWNQSVYVSSSGGSGGKRLFFATDIQQNQLQRQILVDMMLEENIISHTDICLNLFQSNNIYRSFDIFNNFCLMANCTALPMSANSNDEDILEVIQYFRPNIIMGSPYRLMQLAFFIEKQVDKKIKFQKIYFACEPLDEIKQDYFKRIFSCSIYIGFYGSAEAGVFACQSPKYSSTKTYLYPKELVDIEIIKSKIIVTNLIRKRNQLIRFDTGDIGRLISNNQNEKYGLIEVFHSQRLIMVGNDTLSKSNIEETMKQIDLIEWQLIIDYVSNTENNQILLLFRLVKSQLTSVDVLEQNIRNYLQKCFHVSLTSLSEKLSIQFEYIQFNDLIRNKTSNKLLKIIDKRL